MKVRRDRVVVAADAAGVRRVLRTLPFVFQTMRQRGVSISVSGPA
jgi:hypothetical protein